ncbi:MAG: cation transporter, partial [Aeromonadaceae bacterium]|nr:cation transporter [Aeromonadaceae bacterium]
MTQQQWSLPISGMSCAGCAARLERTLAKAPGVVAAAVNFASATAQIHTEGLSGPQLVALVEQAGFQVPVARLALQVTGLSCASCVRRLEQGLAELPGVRELKISDGALRLLLAHDWPGNVRELENCLERATILSESGLI